jgi:arginine N-succinyltransferase
MIVVRAVTLEDLDQLWALIGKATYGLTTLQVSKKQLSERLELAHFAFGRETEKPSGEPYVFVMEDMAQGKLIGVSSIYSKTGGFEPFYSFRRITEHHYCQLLDRTQTVETLHLSKIHDGPTEIGSLFLDRDFRGKGNGRLLSLARFSFIAAHRKRFADEVIAEMRGWMTEDGISPFWEGLGRLFFEMDFPQADILSTHNKRFIEDWFPRYPIYARLLPESARNVIGNVHKDTQPAYAMLTAEGFSLTDMIDIFDGGPTISCQTDEIKAVRRSRTSVVGDISEKAAGTPHIVARCCSGFRAMLAAVQTMDDSADPPPIRIHPLTAATLQLQLGQSITVMPLNPTPSGP